MWAVVMLAQIQFTLFRSLNEECSALFVSVTIASWSHTRMAPGILDFEGCFKVESSAKVST